jgi:exonuclease III
MKMKRGYTITLVVLLLSCFFSCEKAPEPVEKIRAEIGDSSLVLSWDLVANAESYEIYYSEEGDEENIKKFPGKIDPNGTEIKDLVNGKKYSILIYALNSKGMKSEVKKEVFSPVKKELPAPDKVSDVKAVSGNGFIVLTWSNPAGNFSYVAISYGTDNFDKKVLQSDINSEGTKIIGLQNKQKYQFKLIAYDSNNKESEAVVIEQTPHGANPTVEITSAQPIVNIAPVEFTLKFSEIVSGLDKSELSVSGAVIQSFTTEDNIVFKLTVNPSADEVNVIVRCPENVCENADGEGNLASAECSVKYDIINTLQVSSLTFIVPETGSAKISWVNPVGDFSYCNVGYSAVGIDSQKISVDQGSSECLITSLDSTKEYTFEIFTVDNAGNESVESQILKVLPDLSAADVKRRITELPEVFTPSHRASVLKLKNDFDNLSEDQKKVVDNITSLYLAVEKVEALVELYNYSNSLMVYYTVENYEKIKNCYTTGAVNINNAANVDAVSTAKETVKAEIQKIPSIAATFLVDFKSVLDLTAINVTSANLGQINAAITAFNGFDVSVKEQLKDSKSHLDDLLAAINLNSETGLYGRWLFDDSNNLGKAEFGPDLQITGTPEGNQQGVDSTDKAALVDVGEYFTADVEAALTTYSVAIEFKVTECDKYRAFFQAGDIGGDAELFIRHKQNDQIEGQIGVGTLDYTDDAYVSLNQWHKMVFTVENTTDFNIYLDGGRILNKSVSAERFKLINNSIHFFQDESAEDQSIFVSSIEFYTKALSQKQVDNLFKETNLMPDEFTVAFYNIWNGWCSDEDANTHKVSQDNGTAFLNGLNADFIGLSEICYNSDSDLQSWTADWGHSRSRMIYDKDSSPHRDSYPIGCTSKGSMYVVDQQLEKNGVTLGHGYIHVKYMGINLFVTHLSAGYEKSHDLKRAQEASIIMNAIQPLLLNGESVLLMGDFNALSETDKDHYEKMGYHVNYSPNVYDATNVFKNGGLIELNDKMRVPGSYIGSYYAPSDVQKERIDYIWASPDLAEKCISCELVTDAILKQVSDHFPIVATFRK